MMLKITIKVQDKIEAYKIVSELGMEHDIISADLDGYREKFSLKNPPVLFMRDNKKVSNTTLKRFVEIKQNKTARVRKVRKLSR